MASAPPSAGRSRGPALPWRGRETLCVCRVVHNISCHRFVGADAYIGPPGKCGVRRGIWAPPYKVMRCRSRAGGGSALQGKRIPTPVCPLVRNDRENFFGGCHRSWPSVSPQHPCKKEAAVRPPLDFFCAKGLSPPPAGPPGRCAARPAAFAPRWRAHPS